MFITWIKSIIIVAKYSICPCILKIIQAIISALTIPFQLLCIQKLIDFIQIYILEKNYFEYVFVWGILLIISHLFSSNIHFLNTYFDIVIKKNLNDKLPDELVEHFSKIEYSYFEDHKTIDILSKVGDKIQDKLLNVFNDTISFCSTFISIIGVMFVISQISWIFSIIFIVILILIMLIDYKSMYIMNNMFFNQTTAEREMNYYNKLLSQKKSLFEIKIFCCVDYIKEKWIKKSKELFTERLNVNKKSQKLFLISSILNLTWIATVIIYIVLKLKFGEIELGLCISILGSAVSLLSLVENSSYVFSNLSLNSFYINYYNIFKNLSVIHFNDKFDFNETEQYEIEFVNVSFKYPNTENYILKNLNLKFRTNEKIALVGRNGEGKSTIIKLLCKLYEPNDGEILINNMNIKNISYSTLHKIFSIVFQNFIKYQFSIRENMILENTEEIYNDELIKTNLKKIGLDNEIIDDIDRSVGKIEEDGIDLSSGQWQKIAVARALLADNKFTILDEPTASLDPISESNIYELFIKVINKKGSLIISHRLASAKLSDRIFVLQNGKICEDGTHDDLMAKKGTYYEMFKKQSQWYK